ncbi:MAG TPA: tryptophan--tRNA ligase [Candidatus Paceibacterota bacterium]|nr:tryptophan--tRNA ligase [Candidatus Paceibacterota bacterium]
MAQAKKTLLSGVKPTGRPHIGNYFGAMKQFVDLLNTGEYDCYFMIADYHALNFIQNGQTMRDNIIDLAIDYMAIGLDPKKCVLFKQSDVSAHTELCWIFDTITTMPYLMRAHAYKDAEAKDKEISVGTFNYPMLMAADILLYGADVVPVGSDQKQHVEYARDTAQKFNNAFGETFKLPKDLIIESVKTVPGIDGRKMSKSYGNTISLFATDAEIQKAVMSIVTDSGAPGPDGKAGVPVNVRAIHELICSKDYLDNLCAENAGKYKALKDALAKDLQDFIRPMRERREKLAQNRNKVIKVLEKGAKQAKKRADAALALAKKNIGVSL